jgi:hypothetical protein
MYSVCRNHNLVISSLMTYHWACSNSWVIPLHPTLRWFTASDYSHQIRISLFISLLSYKTVDVCFKTVKSGLFLWLSRKPLRSNKCGFLKMSMMIFFIHSISQQLQPLVNNLFIYFLMFMNEILCDAIMQIMTPLL